MLKAELESFLINLTDLLSPRPHHPNFRYMELMKSSENMQPLSLSFLLFLVVTIPNIFFPSYICSAAVMKDPDLNPNWPQISGNLRILTALIFKTERQRYNLALGDSH